MGRDLCGSPAPVPAPGPLHNAERQAPSNSVREATAEIERNFRQLSELRVEQVTERERKRIAADLHDDLGAKLLTIVHTSESERISTLAREALEEMRLSVRGLTGKPVRLADALATGAESFRGAFRHRREWGARRTPPPAALAYVQTSASCARPPATSSNTAARPTAR